MVSPSKSALRCPWWFGSQHSARLHLNRGPESVIMSWFIDVRHYLISCACMYVHMYIHTYIPRSIDIDIFWAAGASWQPKRERRHGVSQRGGNRAPAEARKGGGQAPVCLLYLRNLHQFSSGFARCQGRLFCFLPLPKSAISLRLAAHVHALRAWPSPSAREMQTIIQARDSIARCAVLRPLNTTQDRRNVLMDERVGERELITKNAVDPV